MLFYVRHFTIRGADGTDFEGGVYHGRILLPPEYPFKPPSECISKWKREFNFTQRFLIILT